jgi:hypothetical protein
MAGAGHNAVNIGAAIKASVATRLGRPANRRIFTDDVVLKTRLVRRIHTAAISTAPVSHLAAHPSDT